VFIRNVAVYFVQRELEFEWISVALLVADECNNVTILSSLAAAHG
jgi:hypothetical protein